jgi:glycosyltransferase involved in cell wall biosynthesis
MISVIVPAHNEGLVIAKTLKAMTVGAAPGELDVIVVCNGCTDDTARVARSFGPPVRVIETEVGSKTRALNLGDRAAKTFPRIYADADVIVTLVAIRALVNRLQLGDILAAAPSPSINLTGCSWCVRAYYDIRSRLPSAREGIGGSGVYAISQAGRSRFLEFPSITADDGYVRVQFKPEERETLTDVNTIVFAPRTIRNLIRIRTRAYYGTLELARQYPDQWKNSGERNHKAALSLFIYPTLWTKLLIYCVVNGFARYRAAIRIGTASSQWEQDDTSRSTIARLSDVPGN